MKTIAENNRLIAEFMGIVSFSDTDDTQLWVNIPYSSGLTKGRNYAEWATTWGEVDYSDESKYGYHVPSEFHTSWDWLMPVVDKISELGYLFDIENRESRVLDDMNCVGIVDAYGGSRKENTYEAVVQFIKWYNENKRV